MLYNRKGELYLSKLESFIYVVIVVVLTGITFSLLAQILRFILLWAGYTMSFTVAMAVVTFLWWLKRDK